MLFRSKYQGSRNFTIGILVMCNQKNSRRQENEQDHEGTFVPSGQL